MNPQILNTIGAVLKGHFLLSSGRHSGQYFEKFRLLERPDLLVALVQPMIELFRGQRIEAVVGPTTGGILIAYEAARQLGTRAIYVEREEGKRVLRRGFTLEPGMPVLVVDDVLTTGASVREVLEVVEAARVIVIGIGVLIDRAEQSVSFGEYRLVSTWRLPAETYAPEECPLCRQNVSMTMPGSRNR